MQNDEKIECRMVSEVISPVISPRWEIAERISSASSSEEIPAESAVIAAVRALYAAESASKWRTLETTASPR